MTEAERESHEWQNLSALVNDFRDALFQKLIASERKYGWNGGWAEPGWMDDCRKRLGEHIEKGDPLDVAAYCAFLWYHQERTNE